MADPGQSYGRTTQNEVTVQTEIREKVVVIATSLMFTAVVYGFQKAGVLAAKSDTECVLITFILLKNRGKFTLTFSLNITVY